MKTQFRAASTTMVTTFVAEVGRWHEVRERALSLGISASQFLRDAMAAHLKRTAKEARRKRQK